MILCRSFQTRFRFGSVAVLLNLASHRNSPARSTKSTRSLALPLLVNTGFQVLFHSPPGVLFTFPSRYYTLSVIRSYLALGDGPHIFRQDFSCLDVLRIPLNSSIMSVTGLSPPTDRLSSRVHLSSQMLLSRSLPQRYYYPWFGLLQFRSPLLSESFLLSFPPGT